MVHGPRYDLCTLYLYLIRVSKVQVTCSYRSTGCDWVSETESCTSDWEFVQGQRFVGDNTLA